MSRKKLIVTAIVLTLILAIGGILAYFTSTDTKTNRFKMGNVGITVNETNFPGDPSDPTNKVPVVPNKEIPKNPTVTNNGDGDVYAFVTVKIPRAEVKTSANGVATEQDLFTVRKITDATTGETDPGINDGWLPVGNPEVITENDKSFTLYVYAYATEEETVKKLTPLAKNATTTTPVFDKVKFAGVVETQSGTGSLQGTDLDVVVSGYGIQTEGLESDVPATVWPLVIDQYATAE